MIHVPIWLYLLVCLIVFYLGLSLGCLISSRRRRAAEDMADFMEHQRDQLMETVAERTDQAKGVGE